MGVNWGQFSTSINRRTPIASPAVIESTTPMTSTSKQEPNHLIHETSPYLLQHAYNPVQWLPWNADSLELARRLDRPILLSVGYSSCHWCHVMERESFEDQDTARLMNEHFVNIKVDREERPDVDAIYMNYVQMTTGAGGWPLTVFLTPDLVPFFGGTYFPPQDHFGRPSFRRVLQNVGDAFKNRRDELKKMAPEVVLRLQRASVLDAPETSLTPELLEEAESKLVRDFDPRHGGFGSAPKFPSSMILTFLLNQSLKGEHSSTLQMVKTSLDGMMRGGIYDQLGGGFHRYSVDERWLVPHFEKMLYDNALLVRTYLAAYQVTADANYLRVVEETLGWAEREMTHPEGGFYSAQDADSEGDEGVFFLWTVDEIEEILGHREAALFYDYFDVSKAGNFEGRNILNQRCRLEPLARRAALSPEELQQGLDRSRRKLFQQRETRVKPGLDDKVLASWNGLMLTAFAEAAWALNRPDYQAIAIKNADFLLSRMSSGGRLFRSWKAGQAKLNGYLEDYAAVVEGLLTLFESTGDARWLEAACTFTEAQFELFLDAERGDFYFTASDHQRLLVRHKDHMDNATPSGNSTTCLNLLRLFQLTSEKRFQDTAGKMLEKVGLALSRHPLAFGNWLQALAYYLGPVNQVVVVDSRLLASPLLEPLRRRYLPHTARVIVDPEVPSRLPLLEGKTPVQTPTAYVCRNGSCRRPVTTAADLERQVEGGQATNVSQ